MINKEKCNCVCKNECSCTKTCACKKAVCSCRTQCACKKSCNKTLIFAKVTAVGIMTLGIGSAILLLAIKYDKIDSKKLQNQSDKALKIAEKQYGKVSQQLKTIKKDLKNKIS